MDAPIVARLVVVALLTLPTVAGADYTLRRSIQSPSAIDGDGFGTALAPVGERPDLLVTAPGEATRRPRRAAPICSTSAAGRFASTCPVRRRSPGAALG